NNLPPTTSYIICLLAVFVLFVSISKGIVDWSSVMRTSSSFSVILTMPKIISSSHLKYYLATPSSVQFFGISARCALRSVRLFGFLYFKLLPRRFTFVFVVVTFKLYDDKILLTSSCGISSEI